MIRKKGKTQIYNTNSHLYCNKYTHTTKNKIHNIFTYYINIEKMLVGIVQTGYFCANG